MPARKPTATRKPVAVYLRVSTRDQKDDAQREVITTWLANNGIDPSMVEWYADTESGRTMRRAQFDRLQADIFAGTVKTVIVYKLDRIARRLREGLNTLCGWTDKGIRVVSVTQQVDVSGAMGRMVCAMLFGLAEIEWEYRRERQTDGIRAAKRIGAYAGRQPGTTKGKPDRARELRDKGLAAPEIATAMGISLRTVFRYLDAHPIR